MSVLDQIGNIYRATEAGKSLAQPETWSSRATAIAQFTMLLNAAIPIANEFLGTHFQAGGTDTAAMAQGAVTVMFVFVLDRLHVASNAAAGRKVQSDP